MNWYTKRFGGQQSHPTGPPPQAPAPPVVAQPQAAPQPHTQRPTPSSLQTDHCPACASVNYMAAVGTKVQRCFDCGYPVVQSTSGVGVAGAKTDGTVHKATQVKTGTYSPTTIIGRVE